MAVEMIDETLTAATDLYCRVLVELKAGRSAKPLRGEVLAVSRRWEKSLPNGEDPARRGMLNNAMLMFLRLATSDRPNGDLVLFHNRAVRIASRVYHDGHQGGERIRQAWIDAKTFGGIPVLGDYEPPREAQERNEAERVAVMQR